MREVIGSMRPVVIDCPPHCESTWQWRALCTTSRLSGPTRAGCAGSDIAASEHRGRRVTAASVLLLVGDSRLGLATNVIAGEV